MSSGSPRVLIDARMVGDVPHGIARYVLGIHDGLALLGPLPYEPVFLVSRDQDWNRFAPFRSVRSRTRFLHPLEGLEILSLLFRQGAALFHSTSFSSIPFAGFGAPCPWVQTVHDLNHLRFGSALERAYYVWILRPFFARARALLTVSEFSRSEISSWAGIPKSRIELTRNPLSKPTDPDPSFLSRAGLRAGEYFACVSGWKPHKNIPFLLEAYANYRKASMARSREPLPLAISLQANGSEVLPEGVIPLGALTDEELSALRESARATLFPSLYEGFGLPPLEALLSQSPLLVSSIPPHEEGLEGVEGPFIKKLDPNSGSAWTDALLQWTLTPPSKPPAAIAEGLLSKFSARELGESLDRVYRRVLGLERMGNSK